MNELRSALENIVRDSQLHARWLNTFSYLEYIGCRKIVKSQATDSLHASLLAHIAEEARHAHLLKKLAVKIGGPSFDSFAPDRLLCGAEAEAYFQGVDHACDARIAEPRLKYLYVTHLVEVRALQVYTTHPGGAFAGLINDEKVHLAAAARELRHSDPEFEVRWASLSCIEAQLFQDYLTALLREVT